MAGDDGASAKIESLNTELADAEIKAAAGDNMYLVRAKFLRDKLAAITIPTQQPEAPALPQSLRMTALNTAHTEAKQNYKPEENGTQKFLEGSTQVTVASDNCPTSVSQNLAGALPHAPSETTQKDDRITIRLPKGMRPRLEAKASAVESSLTAYVQGLIASDLDIPIDEERLQRSRMLGDQIADLTVAINRTGNNINQISKSAHEGKPCALSRSEITQTLQQHTAAVAAVIKLGGPG
jgi:hypothetical protein